MATAIKKERVELYNFGTLEEIRDTYLRYMRPEQLEKIVKEWKSKPFKRRETDDQTTKLQMLDKLNVDLHDYCVKNHCYDPLKKSPN